MNPARSSSRAGSSPSSRPAPRHQGTHARRWSHAAGTQSGAGFRRTQIPYGNNHNLPVLLAGGGFKHGQHLAFDKTNNYPLPNLYVSMLQRLGIEAGKFASSTGTMRGLVMA